MLLECLGDNREWAAGKGRRFTAEDDARRCGGAVGLIGCEVMVDNSLRDPAAIDALLDADDLAGARAALESTPSNDEQYAVVRIKLSLYEGSLASGAAMQALIQLMRRNPDWPGAKALYQRASSAAFETRQSSVSHSHAPPPVERK